MSESIDHVFGEFGFIVKWVPYQPDEDGEASSITFTVDEIIAREGNDRIAKTERYLEGYIKWDSCSHFYFGEDKDGYLHLCGREPIKKHAALMEWLFNRAFDLMHREPED